MHGKRPTVRWIRARIDHTLRQAAAESGRQFYRQACPLGDASSPSEFFAVATETFFEKPVELKEQHPLLYEELRKFYQVDPSSWY